MNNYKDWIQKEIKKSNICHYQALNMNKMQFGMLDEGPGIRNAIFLQGCPNFCPGCQNISTKHIQINQLISPQNAAKYLTTAQAASFAIVYTSQKQIYMKLLLLNALKHILWDLIDKPISLQAQIGLSLEKYQHLIKIFLDKVIQLTKGHNPQYAPTDWSVLPVTGITISGGEPLIQPDQVLSLIKEVKKLKPKWNICLYTGLYSFKQIIDNPKLYNFVKQTDILKIGQFKWKLTSLAHFYYGSSNQILADTKLSLLNNSLVPKKLPTDLQLALDLATNHLKAGLRPHLKKEILNKIPLIELEGISINNSKDFENLFVKIDTDIISNIFEFIPDKTNTKIYFTSEAKINFSKLKIYPLSTTEYISKEIYLQGNLYPPSADTNPRTCKLNYGQQLESKDLLKLIEASYSWQLNSSKKDNEDQEKIRLNLALQNHLLKIQSRYFLLQSPYSNISLSAYQKIIYWYRKQLDLLFTPGQPSPKSIFFRLGDPMLQLKSVSQFCKEAKQGGYEVWLEFPQKFEELKKKNLQELYTNSDFWVCGPLCQRRPPSLLPFKSSEEQTIIQTGTDQVWEPRFSWSAQIVKYRQKFSRPENIASFKLPSYWLDYFRHNPPSPLSLEELEKLAGPVMCEW